MISCAEISVKKKDMKGHIRLGCVTYTTEQKNMRTLLVLILATGTQLYKASEPCVCECKCDYAVHEMRRILDEPTRRRLDTFSDIQDQITSLSSQIGDIGSGLDYVQTSLIEIRNEVVGSVSNATDSIGTRISDFVDYIGDEIDTAKDNAVSTLESLASTALYGVIGLMCGIVFVTFLVACVPWIRKKYCKGRCCCNGGDKKKM
jgi:hypothetical protein